ncbi:MAG TPA: polysaccharide biosynthesis protein [Chloroflexota bacterium]|nr:polysaccharide biosynthesis protein [Chloroflexota bacterium]
MSSPTTEMGSPDAPPADMLLGRPQFAGDVRVAAQWVRGRRVLVTGAAGSVGVPLARILLRAETEHLALLDHHEYSLFNLERSLARPHAGLSYELADVRDTPRLQRLFEQHRPQTVFHLAAAKHVGYGERFPEGAVDTNVLASATLLQLAQQAGVEEFVYPSSDKSVAPPSLYGATKRITECLVQAHPGKVVRYVNIIGTRGSVIEIFTNQVREDRPLSVTDERMTRYWISMDEALWSLLMTGLMATPGQVLLPACGQPMPLLETAQRLVDWYRPHQQPYPIAWTGMAPGERLHEVLLSENEFVSDGPVTGLRLVDTHRQPGRLQVLPEAVAELRELVRAGERERLRQRCLELAEALQ